MADNALMYATLDRVVAAAADGSWNQKMWVEINECGTAFCYAGHYLHSQGWQACRMPDSQPWATFGLARGGEILTWTMIGQCAADELGLTNAEADALFEEGNTLEDLKEIVDEIANGTFHPDDRDTPIMFVGDFTFSEVPF